MEACHAAELLSGETRVGIRAPRAQVPTFDVGAIELPRDPASSMFWERMSARRWSMKREQRLVERLEGRGQILSGQRRLADVAYELDVYREFLQLENDRGKLELAGAEDVRGRVDLIAGSKDLLFGTEDLWLYLEDGSRLEALCVVSSEGRYCDLIGRGRLIRADAPEAKAV